MDRRDSAFVLDFEIMQQIADVGLVACPVVIALLAPVHEIDAARAGPLKPPIATAICRLSEFMKIGHAVRFMARVPRDAGRLLDGKAKCLHQIGHQDGSLALKDYIHLAALLPTSGVASTHPRLAWPQEF